MSSIIIKNLPECLFKTDHAEKAHAKDPKIQRVYIAKKALLVDTIMLTAGAIFGILCLLKVIPVSPAASWAITVPFGLGAVYTLKLNFDAVADDNQRLDKNKNFGYQKL